MSDARLLISSSIDDDGPSHAVRDKRGAFGVHAILSLVVFLLGTWAKTVDELSDTGSPLSFPVLCALVLVYAGLQVALLRRFQPAHWAINPAAQTAIFIHALPTLGVTVLQVLPDEVQFNIGFDLVSDQWAVRYEWLNLVGAIALWTGYWSGCANPFVRYLQRSTFLRSVIRPTLSLNYRAALVLGLISCGFRLLTIRMGLYGYSSSVESVETSGAYSQYLALAGNLGRVTLIAVSLACFQSGSAKWLLATLVVVETGFGVLTGFKSAVVLPILLVGGSYYAIRGRFPAILFPSVAVGIFAAYALIEPFRQARYKEADFDGSSLFSIVDTFAASRDDVYEGAAPGGVTTTFARFLQRVSDVGSAAPGIEYAARWDVLPEGSPRFLEDIFLSPLYSVIPRFVWDGKPVNDTGLWYTQVVIGTPMASSTAMYPVTYLNFAGGESAVFLGFLVVGIIQSALFRGLMTHGRAVAFVLLCMAGFLGHIDSVYYSFFISVIRNIPLLLALQWLLFRATPISRGPV